MTAADYSDKAAAKWYYFEAWEDADGTIQNRNETLSEVDVSDWLDLAGRYAIPIKNGDPVDSCTMSLRLIFCPLYRDPFMLSCNDQTYQRIQTSFRLHKTTEEVIVNNNGVFMRYHSTCQGVDKPFRDFALVMKMPNFVNVGYDSLSLSFNSSTRTVNAFLHGSYIEDYERLLSVLMHPDSVSRYKHPLFLATELVCDHRRRLERYRTAIDEHVLKSERRIGYVRPGILAIRPKVRPAPTFSTEKLDFEEIVKTLHSCLTELIGLSRVTGFNRDLCTFLRDTLKELQEPFPKLADDSVDELTHQIDFSSNVSKHMEVQSVSLKERVQGHINLTFSLIAQEENRISRSVAEDSAMIAVASKRDSSAMKTIAVLTTVFLPPTFVATFFSMSMFDWSSTSHDGRIMSPYIWVYWAISIPLTAMVLLIWRVWFKRQDGQYQRELRKAKQDIRTQPLTDIEQDRKRGNRTSRRDANNSTSSIGPGSMYPGSIGPGSIGPGSIYPGSIQRGALSGSPALTAAYSPAYTPVHSSD